VGEVLDSKLSDTSSGVSLLSVRRNKYQDRTQTVACIKGVRSSRRGGKQQAALNWLGHKRESQTATLDEMLLLGCTAKELCKVRKSYSAHLHHLRSKHGLVIERSGDFYRFALEQHPRKGS